MTFIVFVLGYLTALVVMHIGKGVCEPVAKSIDLSNPYRGGSS